MHPDFPPHGNSGPDPVERMLGGLPTPALPADWRSSILTTAIPPPAPPIFGKFFTVFLTTAWSVIALLHFTTPPPTPTPGRVLQPVTPTPPAFRDGGAADDPWLALNFNP
ncbi:MAG: hypothetical protein JWL81_3339 [Verrucomicrobiales bacterium]|nr:hypothetical protein [Verrucomicrobiales bacterium]